MNKFTFTMSILCVMFLAQATYRQTSKDVVSTVTWAEESIISYAEKLKADKSDTTNELANNYNPSYDTKAVAELIKQVGGRAKASILPPIN